MGGIAMKTIEERAKSYACNKRYITHKRLKDVCQDAIKDAYINGAQEQCEVDKLNFEKWYCKNKCEHRTGCTCPSHMCLELNNIKQIIWN